MDATKMHPGLARRPELQLRANSPSLVAPDWVDAAVATVQVPLGRAPDIPTREVERSTSREPYHGC